MSSHQLALRWGTSGQPSRLKVGCRALRAGTRLQSIPDSSGLQTIPSQAGCQAPTNHTFQDEGSFLRHASLQGSGATRRHHSQRSHSGGDSDQGCGWVPPGSRLLLWTTACPGPVRIFCDATPPPHPHHHGSLQAPSRAVQECSQVLIKSLPPPPVPPPPRRGAKTKPES